MALLRNRIFKCSWPWECTDEHLRSRAVTLAQAIGKLKLRAVGGQKANSPARREKRSDVPAKAYPKSLVSLAMVVVVPVLVPALVMVPGVIVFNSAMISVPVTREILVSVVVRFHPSSALIGWSRVVPFMPFVVPSDWIPIPGNPDVPCAWTGWHDMNNARSRRRPDSDTQ